MSIGGIVQFDFKKIGVGVGSFGEVGFKITTKRVLKVLYNLKKKQHERRWGG